MHPGERDQGRGIRVLAGRPLFVRHQGYFARQARSAAKPATKSLHQGQVRCAVGCFILPAGGWGGHSCLFLVALDDERTSFRYHQLVRQVLRAELRARDQAREQALQLRAGEWFEATGEIRRATRHFLAARQADRALALLQDRVAADFLNNPALPAPLDVNMIDPSLLASAPDRRRAGTPAGGVTG
jgi:hypothetical protein